MPRVYVLDVPEFDGLVNSARSNPACTIRNTKRGYIVIESDVELQFHRAATGFNLAVWYGSLTGGIDGTITEFNRDTVRIVNSETQR